MWFTLNLSRLRLKAKIIGKSSRLQEYVFKVVDAAMVDGFFVSVKII